MLYEYLVLVGYSTQLFWSAHAYTRERVELTTANTKVRHAADLRQFRSCWKWTCLGVEM